MNCLSSFNENQTSLEVFPEKRPKILVEIDRYSFFGADADIPANYGPITDISKICKSCFLLHYQKYDVVYALLFFKNFKNQDL